MIKMEPNMCPDDVQQWLREGYFYYRKDDDGDLMIGTIDYWAEHSEDSYVIRNALTDERWSVPDVCPYVFPHWPEIASINLPEYCFAVHLSRLQMKQWRRTYNSRQLRLTVPRKWELSGQNAMAYNVNINDKVVATSAFTPEYPTLEEAAARLDEGWASVALNQAVIVTNTAPRYVYYRGDLAGRLLHGKYEAIDAAHTPRLLKLFPGGLTL
jgi:hypothetical protein